MGRTLLWKESCNCFSNSFDKSSTCDEKGNRVQAPSHFHPYIKSRQKTRPSSSLVILKTLASLYSSPFVAVIAKFPTNADNPLRFNGGPCFPDLNPYVVEQVGQATLGTSSHATESVIRSPLNKSKAHRGQSPCTANNSPPTLVQAI